MQSHIKRIVLLNILAAFVYSALLFLFPKFLAGEVFLSLLLISLINISFSIYLTKKIETEISLVKNSIEFIVNNTHKELLPDDLDLTELVDLKFSLRKLNQFYNEKLLEESEKRKEQHAIISSLNDGVLALDLNENVIKYNKAASNILCFKEDISTKKNLVEIIRNHELLEFVREGARLQTHLEKEISIYEDTKKILKLSLTPIKNLQDRTIGILVVFSDITQLREIENIRRDFVANVSHELKTPITSIKGFVETILSGAVNKPEELQRFLEIVERQANRLEFIIEELLNLANIEQNIENKQIKFSLINLREILEHIVAAQERRLIEKNINCNINCPQNLYINANRPLFEQAIQNLLSNAINYSDCGKEIELNVSKEDQVNVIKVKDNGIGISSEHLPRIFERFYRVDKSRSRQEGGSGLGLSIVKHIVLAHNGDICVNSELGRGTEFCLRLP